MDSSRACTAAWPAFTAISAFVARSAAMIKRVAAAPNFVLFQGLTADAALAIVEWTGEMLDLVIGDWRIRQVTGEATT